MLQAQKASVPGLLGLGLGVLLIAIFLGLLSALAPGLAVLVAILAVIVGILAGSYAWSRHIAMGDTRMAVYLLLFWVWVANVPAIVAFDPSGITRLDLFNPQSLSRIGLFFMVGLVMLVNYLSTPRRMAMTLPAIWPRFTLLILIFGWYAIDALLLLRGQSLLLALYRIVEWGLLLFLVAALLVRAPSDPLEREKWLLRVVFALLVFMLLITMVLLPIVPNRVYFVGQSGVGRLGNPFAHPNTLGVLAAMAFFYFLEMRLRFFRLGMLLALGIMAATYSRGAWLGFSLAIAFYVLLKPRTVQGRFFVGTAMVFAAVLGWFTQDMFMDTVQRVLARGGSVTNLQTASERTEVWRAAKILIAESPVIGHGYIAGPKKLNDVMASGVSAAYFRAVHAHNEFIQTQINGGMPASLLLVVFLARTLYLLRSLATRASSWFFRCVTAWAIMLWTFGMLTPNISGQLLILGALLIYLYVVLEFLHSDQRTRSDMSNQKTVNRIYHAGVDT